MHTMKYTYILFLFSFEQVFGVQFCPVTKLTSIVWRRNHDANITDLVSTSEILKQFRTRIKTAKHCDTEQQFCVFEVKPDTFGILTAQKRVPHKSEKHPHCNTKQYFEKLDCFFQSVKSCRFYQITPFVTSEFNKFADMTCSCDGVDDCNFSFQRRSAAVQFRDSVMKSPKPKYANVPDRAKRAMSSIKWQEDCLTMALYGNKKEKRTSPRKKRTLRMQQDHEYQKSCSLL